ncbi:hypothetical protein HK405_006052 [Cladochytrium tenue]|nr:hypothetical protein HK405_006052 [Cladochytrium tenue]
MAAATATAAPTTSAEPTRESRGSPGSSLPPLSLLPHPPLSLQHDQPCFDSGTGGGSICRHRRRRDACGVCRVERAIAQLRRADAAAVAAAATEAAVVEATGRERAVKERSRAADGSPSLPSPHVPPTRLAAVATVSSQDAATLTLTSKRGQQQEQQQEQQLEQQNQLQQRPAAESAELARSVYDQYYHHFNHHPLQWHYPPPGSIYYNSTQAPATVRLAPSHAAWATPPVTFSYAPCTTAAVAAFLGGSKVVADGQGNGGGRLDARKY